MEGPEEDREMIRGGSEDRRRIGGTSEEDRGRIDKWRMGGGQGEDTRNMGGG